MKVYGCIQYGLVVCIGYGIGRRVGDEVYSSVGDEVGEGVKLEVWVLVVYIKDLKMKAMWRLITV